MLRIVSFGLLIILQVVTAEPPPPHCRGPPPGTEPEKCCDIPHTMFKEGDLKECGLETPADGIRPTGPPDCSKAQCILKKYNLLKDDNLDKDAANEFLDKWVESNPDFKDAVEKAKEVCLKSDAPGPPHFCEPLRVMFCMKHVVYMECPNWKDSDNCKKIKDHIEECKAYFP